MGGVSIWQILLLFVMFLIWVLPWGACFNIKKGKRNAQDNLVSNVVFYIVDWLLRLLLCCYQRATREEHITSKSYSPMLCMGCEVNLLRGFPRSIWAFPVK